MHLAVGVGGGVREHPGVAMEREKRGPRCCGLESMVEDPRRPIRHPKQIDPILVDAVDLFNVVQL